MCFIIGQLLSGGVLRGLVSRQDQWGYRIPFALQWFWPLVLMPIIFFAPESPWHLVRHNRLEEAEKSIRRLQQKSAGLDPKDTLATIVYTNNLEESLSVGTTYWDCFKGFERRRTEVTFHPSQQCFSMLTLRWYRLPWLCSVASLSAVFALPMPVLTSSNKLD